MLKRSNYTNYRCICGSSDFQEIKKHGIELEECLSCGIIQQITLPFITEKQYHGYYKNKYPPTQEQYVNKEYKTIKKPASFENKGQEKLNAYDHDRRLADLRCGEYGLDKNYKGEILDVGCGSGALVDECRDRGINAYGCEISKYSYAQRDDFIYRERLEKVYFPTDNFDIVTCHDVIEHTLRPGEFAKELFRITNQQGICIIDIPNFFHESGVHHWKAIEHVWYFTNDQLRKLLEDVGFVVNEVRHPIPSKTVFYLSKPIQKRPTILVPPGMGDSYWSMVKMQSFLREEKIDMPDICIGAGRERKYDGHIRAVPFLKLFPFVNATGGHISIKDIKKGNKIWKEAYAERGRTVFRDIFDHDYMLSFNGHIRWGFQLEDIDPQYECNWHPPMFVSLEQEKYKKQCMEKYGKYICIYLPLYGHYSKWLDEFSLEDIIKSINKLTSKCKLMPVLVGAQWDADDKTLTKSKGSIDNLIDLTGKTDVQEVLGCLSGSQLVFGFPSGLTFTSTVMRKKTLIVWNDFYEIGIPGNKFYRYCCPPDTWEEQYFAMNTATMTVDNVAMAANDIISGRKPNLFWPKSSTIKKINTKKRAMARATPPKKLCPITILCILKTGDGFSLEYVEKLKLGIERNTTVPYEFVCLTDKNIPLEICESIKLKHDLRRGWSKIEMFRPGLFKTKHILFFALDTVITGNIDGLLAERDDFIALKPWHLKNKLSGLFAPGMMLWKNGGTYSFIYDQFKREQFGSEMEYIADCVKAGNYSIPYFQDQDNGIYSYKRHCRAGLPQNANIVCFLNRPKPHDVEAPWIKDHWI